MKSLKELFNLTYEEQLSYIQNKVDIKSLYKKFNKYNDFNINNVLPYTETKYRCKKKEMSKPLFDINTTNTKIRFQIAIAIVYLSMKEQKQYNEKNFVYICYYLYRRTSNNNSIDADFFAGLVNAVIENPEMFIKRLEIEKEKYINNEHSKEIPYGESLIEHSLYIPYSYKKTLYHFTKEDFEGVMKYNDGTISLQELYNYFMNYGFYSICKSKAEDKGLKISKMTYSSFVKYFYKFGFSLAKLEKPKYTFVKPEFQDISFLDDSNSEEIETNTKEPEISLEKPLDINKFIPKTKEQLENEKNLELVLSKTKIEINFNDNAKQISNPFKQLKL